MIVGARSVGLSIAKSWDFHTQSTQIGAKNKHHQVSSIFIGGNALLI